MINTVAFICFPVSVPGHPHCLGSRSHGGRQGSPAYLRARSPECPRRAERLCWLPEKSLAALGQRGQTPILASLSLWPRTQAWTWAQWRKAVCVLRGILEELAAMAPKTFPSLTYTDRVEIFIFYLRNLVPPKGQRFFFFSVHLELSKNPFS